MTENKIICFQQDTKERKNYFKAASFAHPAKMVLGLQIYLIEHYTKPGDTILDPMAGSGTILMACTLGRNVVLVELEDKFVKMQQDNYEKIKSLGPMLGYTLGEATILQGDARCLDGLLADNILFSPPYAEAQEGGGIAKKGYINNKSHSKNPDTIGNRSYMPSQHGKSEGQIGNLPYGEISAVISSPPYEGSLETSSRHTKGGIPERDKKLGQTGTYADVICTSPPYEESIAGSGENSVQWWNDKAGGKGFLKKNYGESNNNIGNLKSENYLQAMLQVYRQCHRVLKENGLMVLVVKNFIRDKKIIRLDFDTIKICKKAGFKLKETLKRKLTQQSFWRIISLLKCDHRTGSKDNPDCKLGLICPVIFDKQLEIGWAAKKEEDNLEAAQKIVEKLCPKFINTMHKIKYEDVLVFQRAVPGIAT